MSRPLLLLALCAAPAPARAQGLDVRLAEDLTARGVARLELVLGRDTYVVGESFPLSLSIEVERTFLEQELVQLFQRKLELPLQVQAPWLEALDGAELGPFAAQDGPRLALGEELVRVTRLADVEREGHAYARFELARPCRATRVGPLELAAPVLRLAYAKTFVDDVLEGRVARDRHDALVHGGARTLTILPPPEEGRPPEFSGAIGAFTFQARATRSALVVGEPFTLELEVTGSGDLSGAAAPHLEGLADFHVLGQLVEPGPERLLARFDLVPERAGTLTLPPQRYVTFDTTPPAGYRTLTSEALVLECAAGTARAVEPSTTRAEDAAARPARRTWPWFLAGGLGAALLFGLAILRRRS